MAAKKPPANEPLSRDRVLAAALDLLDREGLEGISMRRVGDALGVEAMSLYRYVPSKAALLDGLYEAVLAELPAPPPAKHVGSVLRERSLALRSTLRAHPHALPLFASRPAVTPASIAHVEFVLETLARAGFSPSRALDVLQVIFAFVIGHTLISYSPRRSDETSYPHYAALREEAFPRVREAALTLDRHDAEAEFELGLSALFAGLGLDRGKRPVRG
jgi:AcrR family transcriptional regulator